MADGLDEATAWAVYDILVAHAGATEVGRDQFFYHQTTHRCDEYRFQGALGFGGKFRRDGDRMYVDCYPEDMTDDRRARIDATNRALDNLDPRPFRT